MGRGVGQTRRRDRVCTVQGRSRGRRRARGDDGLPIGGWRNGG